MTISNIGHQFIVPTPTNTIKFLKKGDLDKLNEEVSIEYDEPEQLEVAPVVGKQESQQTEQQRVETAINNMKEWILAAEEMQKVLGEKLKNRRVRVDPRTNPAVRDAIRRVFGIDSDTITYEMFKHALKLRSDMLQEGRIETYGSSS